MCAKPVDKPRTQTPPATASAAVADFLQKVATTPAPSTAPGQRGRLLFALDATASRGPTWDQAMHIQGEMFQEAASLGGLDIQLAYYRGFGEFKATRWLSDGQALLRAMTGVACLAGRTQIERVLRHALAETKQKKVNAVVFVGDCMEENLDLLADAAGHLGLAGVPVFLFHEGPDPLAEAAFQHIARLTGGACCRFDAGSAEHLRQLLRAVAVFAAGGRRALEDYGKRTGGLALALTDRLHGQR